MKNLLKLSTMIMIMGLCSVVLARDGKEDKIINKYQEVINNSAPDDWYTLAESADICLKRNINRKEVASWIDKSLSIKETPYNLEVKGDYYMLNNLPKKAAEYYVKAVQMINEQEPNKDISDLQEKIADALKIKTAS